MNSFIQKWGCGRSSPVRKQVTGSAGRLGEDRPKIHNQRHRM